MLPTLELRYRDHESLEAEAVVHTITVRTKDEDSAPYANRRPRRRIVSSAGIGEGFRDALITRAHLADTLRCHFIHDAVY